MAVLYVNVNNVCNATLTFINRITMFMSTVRSQ